MVPKTDAIEELLVLKKHRVKEAGDELAKPVYPGDKIRVSGFDKLELLTRGLATRDLNAKVKADDKKVKADDKK